MLGLRDLTLGRFPQRPDAPHPASQEAECANIAAAAAAAAAASPKSPASPFDAVAGHGGSAATPPVNGAATSRSPIIYFFG